MSAQGEEAVVDPDRGHAEQFGEQPGEDLLLRGARRPAGARRVHLRHGQGLAVHLAVGGQRQRVQHHERGRHHVVGQHIAQTLVQQRRLQPLVRSGDDVADQALVAGPVLADQCDGLGDTGLRGQRCLDLAEFDAEAADLHLVVGAADELQLAVDGPAGQVTGAVQASARRAERVGDEPLRRQGRAAQIAARLPQTRQIQLTRCTGRDGPEVLVEDVGTGVPHRTPDRRRLIAAERVAHRGAHGHLGGAVRVDHPTARRPPLHHIRRGRLARHDQGHPLGQRVGRQRGERGGRDRGVRDGVFGDELAERVAGQQPVGRGQDHGGAGEPGHAQLRHARVEAGRGELEHPAARLDAEALDLCARQVGQTAVGDHDALGPAGRTRRVDDVRRVGRIQWGDAIGVHQVRVRPRGQRRGAGRGVHEQQPVPVSARGGDPVRQPGRGDDECGPGVVEHVADAVGRVVGVHGQERRTGLADGEQGDGPLHRARQCQRHELLRTHTACDELVRQPVGPGVQVGEGHRRVLEAQRDRLRRTACLGLEQLRQRRPRHLSRRVVPLLLGPPLVGAEHLDLSDRPLGIRGHRLQQPHQSRGQGVHRRPVKEVAAEVDHAVDALRGAVRRLALGQLEGQVELGGRHSHRLPLGPQPRQADVRHRRGLQGQHGLDEGVAGEGALGVEGFYEAFEGEVLVRVGGEVGGAGAVQEFAEGGVAAGVGAQDEGVDEEADEVVKGFVGASCDGGADRDVVSRAQLGVQRAQCGLQDHEEAGAGVPCQCQQVCVQLRREGEGDGVAGEVAGCRAGPVGRQPQLLGQPRECGGPVGELLADGALGVVLSAQDIALPQGVVGVLHRQR